MWFLQLFLNDLLKAVLCKMGRREIITFLLSVFGLVERSYKAPNGNFSVTSGSIHEGILL